jgi:hypothetical protein
VSRSGERATFAGASDVPGGVTNDLCYLYEITVSEDDETVLLDGLGSGGGTNVLFVLPDGSPEPGYAIFRSFHAGMGGCLTISEISR